MGQVVGFDGQGLAQSQYLTLNHLSDGNPVGTIIQYLGIIPPKGYLACDGTVHNIEEYPELSDFIYIQFGSSNYFGGDGETTFAVPDMRNLFLRGYHGDAEEKLSGNIGEKQEATEHRVTTADRNGASIGWSLPSVSGVTSGANNIDKGIPGDTSYGGQLSSGGLHTGNEAFVNEFYTSRPVNMAVLYCIKAEPCIAAVEEYDTDDGWNVRKWTDGYVEMSLVREFTSESNMNNWAGWRFFEKAIPYVDFPIALTKRFSENAFVVSPPSDQDGADNAGYILLQRGVPSLTRTCAYTYMCNYDFHAKDLTVSIFVTGRWK